MRRVAFGESLYACPQQGPIRKVVVPYLLQQVDMGHVLIGATCQVVQQSEFFRVAQVGCLIAPDHGERGLVQQRPGRRVPPVTRP